MYRYANVEQAVARCQRIPDAGMGAFRARLRHLRHQGVPDVPRPGKGRPVQYTLDHAAQLAFALELEALGVPPHPTAKLVHHAWANTDVPHYIKVSVSQPRFLVMELNFIAEFSERGTDDEIYYSAFDVLSLDDVMAHMREIGGNRRAATVINLTAVGDYLRDRLR